MSCFFPITPKNDCKGVHVATVVHAHVHTGPAVRSGGLALDWGLVDWVVDEGAFEGRIAELTARVLSMAWTSTRLTKKLTNMTFDTPFAQFVETYFEYQQMSTDSPEHHEAMAAHRADRESR